MDLTTFISQYATLFCSLDKINDFLSKLTCLPDGTFQININNCCYNIKKIDISQILALLELTTQSEILDGLSNLNDSNIEGTGFTPLTTNLQCACENLQNIESQLDTIFDLLVLGLNTLNDDINVANNSLSNINTNTNPISDIYDRFQTILNLLNEPYVVKHIPYTEYYFDGTPGTYNFSTLEGDNSYIRLQLDLTQEEYEFRGGLITYDFIYGLSGCYQKIALLWSDGTYTDKDGIALDPVAIDLQQNSGHCYAGILPNIWNTEYTLIT